jgi:hypothetical protein
MATHQTADYETAQVELAQAINGVDGIEDVNRTPVSDATHVIHVASERTLDSLRVALLEADYWVPEKTIKAGEHSHMYIRRDSRTTA